MTCQIPSVVFRLNLFEKADLSFSYDRRAVFSLRNDIGLPESAIANSSSVFVFRLTMCPLRSSSDTWAVFLISKASEIAITENLSFWYSLLSVLARCLFLDSPAQFPLVVPRHCDPPYY